MSRGGSPLPRVVRRRPPLSHRGGPEVTFRLRQLQAIATHSQRHRIDRIISEFPDCGLDCNTLIAYTGAFYDQPESSALSATDELRLAQLVDELLPRSQRRQLNRVISDQAKLAAWKPIVRRRAEYVSIDNQLGQLVDKIAARSQGDLEPLNSSSRWRPEINRLGDLTVELARKGEMSGSMATRLGFNRQRYQLRALEMAAKSAAYEALIWMTAAERTAGLEEAARFVAEVFADYEGQR